MSPAMKAAVLVALCLFSLPLLAADRLRPSVIAEPIEDFKPVSLRLDQPPVANDTLARTRGQIVGADFLRLRLFVASPAPLTNASLIVADAGGQAVDTIDLAGKQGEEIWTRIVPGNEYTVRITGPAQPAGATVTVWQVIRNVTPPVALSIVGRDDREQIVNVNEPALRAAGRAVAKLLFQGGGRTFSCTGFLIDPRRFVTNEHCIATAATCATAVVLFDYDTVAMVPPENQRRCARLQRVDHDLDVSVFDLDQAAAAAIHPLALASRSPNDGQVLIVVEHPGGEPKQVSRIDCKSVHTPVRGNGTDTDFTHSCDTLNGSSGSPMLNASFEVVGLHHFGIGDDEPTFNRAVRIEPLLQILRNIP